MFSAKIFLVFIPWNSISYSPLPLQRVVLKVLLFLDLPMLTPSSSFLVLINEINLRICKTCHTILYLTFSFYKKIGWPKKYSLYSSRANVRSESYFHLCNQQEKQLSTPLLDSTQLFNSLSLHKKKRIGKLVMTHFLIHG